MMLSSMSAEWNECLIICDCKSVKCDNTIKSPPFDLHGYLKMHFRHQISSKLGKITFSKYLKFENIYKGAVI